MGHNESVEPVALGKLVNDLAEDDRFARRRRKDKQFVSIPVLLVGCNHPLDAFFLIRAKRDGRTGRRWQGHARCATHRKGILPHKHHLTCSRETWQMRWIHCRHEPLLSIRERLTSLQDRLHWVNVRPLRYRVAFLPITDALERRVAGIYAPASGWRCCSASTWARTWLA